MTSPLFESQADRSEFVWFGDLSLPTKRSEIHMSDALSAGHHGVRVSS